MSVTKLMEAGLNCSGGAESPTVKPAEAVSVPPADRMSLAVML
jgi:hypothetical protein